LSFVPKELLPRRRGGYFDGPPALAIEIVSPDSVFRDYVQKRQIYEDAGVQEYWIIDPEEKRATFLCLRNGRFKKMTPVRHVWHSKVLPGPNFDVRWFWDENRPEPDEVVQQLLRDSQ